MVIVIPVTLPISADRHPKTRQELGLRGVDFQRGAVGGEPLPSVDLRELAHLARPGRPLDGEGVRETTADASTSPHTARRAPPCRRAGASPRSRTGPSGTGCPVSSMNSRAAASGSSSGPVLLSGSSRRRNPCAPERPARCTRNTSTHRSPPTLGRPAFPHCAPPSPRLSSIATMRD